MKQEGDNSCFLFIDHSSKNLQKFAYRFDKTDTSSSSFLVQPKLQHRRMPDPIFLFCTEYIQNYIRS